MLGSHFFGNACSYACMELSQQATCSSNTEVPEAGTSLDPLKGIELALDLNSRIDWPDDLRFLIERYPATYGKRMATWEP